MESESADQQTTLNFGDGLNKIYQINNTVNEQAEHYTSERLNRAFHILITLSTYITIHIPTSTYMSHSDTVR